MSLPSGADGQAGKRGALGQARRSKEESSSVVPSNRRDWETRSSDSDEHKAVSTAEEPAWALASAREQCDAARQVASSLPGHQLGNAVGRGRQQVRARCSFLSPRGSVFRVPSSETRDVSSKEQKNRTAVSKHVEGGRGAKGDEYCHPEERWVCRNRTRKPCGWSHDVGSGPDPPASSASQMETRIGKGE